MKTKLLLILTWMDNNITLSKNQLQAILELVSQLGSNRSQNVPVTNVTPNTWERKALDDNGNDKNCVDVYHINNNITDNNINSLDNVTNSIDDATQELLVTDKYNPYSTSMETIGSSNQTLFWKTLGDQTNINSLTKHHQQASSTLESPTMDYSYPYFSYSYSPLIKSQSLGAIEGSVNRDSEIGKLPIANYVQSPSLMPPRTAPSTSHSLLSFGSSQDQSPVNFRRYARSITSSVGSIFGGGDPVDWEEKRTKILKYRAELAAQKAEKERREKEERDKSRLEEESAERKMIAVQRRLKEEYEMERRLIEAKREAVEQRRLAVVAAIEQAKNSRGKNREESSQVNSFNRNYNSPIILPNHLISVATQTEWDNLSTANEFLRSNKPDSYLQYNTNSKTKQCSSSSQTDISLLFDLIRSLGFSTMTLKCPSDDDCDQDDHSEDEDEHGENAGKSRLLRSINRLKNVNNQLSRTSRSRLGRNFLKFELNDNLTKSNQSKRAEIISKSASHNNLTRIGNPRLDPEKPVNRLKLSSSSSNLSSSDSKQNRLKTANKKQSTSNLPLIVDNRMLKRESVSSTRRKISVSTLQGIL